MKTSLDVARGLLQTFCFLVCFLPFGAQGANPAQAPDAPRQEVRLLTIGNSFADNSTAFLPQLSEAGGKHLILFRANLGGHSLEQHVGYLQAFEADPNDPKGHAYKQHVDPRTGAKKDFSLREALESQPWDVVTIQQVSHKSFKPETYQPYANILIAYIHKYAPQAEIMIHETWAYGDDVFPNFNKGKTEVLDQKKMYDGLSAAYRKLAEETGLRVLPVGDAFQKARALPLVVNREANIHANENGQYLGAAVFYETIFHDNVEKVSYAPEKVSPEDAAALRHIAHETVAQEAAAHPVQAAH